MLLPVDTQFRDDRTPPPQLLFICVANVCRSPVLEFLTARGLRRRGVARSWQFASAGTAVSDERRMCSRSAAALRDLPGGWDFALAHRSRPLTHGLVEESALILVASQQERSAVVELSPPARARTFTILEAALLAERAASRARQLTTSAGPGDEGVPTLEELAQAMHLSRGLLPPEATSLPARLRFRRSRFPGHLDIVDVHGRGRRRHAPVLADLGWASDHLASAFARLSVPGR